MSKFVALVLFAALAVSPPLFSFQDRPSRSGGQNNRFSLSINNQSPETLFQLWGTLAHVSIRFSPSYERDQPIQSASIDVKNSSLEAILFEIGRVTKSCFSKSDPDELLVEVCQAETAPRANTPDPPVAAPVTSRLIVVGEPKVYDDLYLQNQLAALQTQLASTHAVDQSTLLSHIGGVQGFNQQQMSVGVGGSGPPAAGTSTFTLAPNVPAFSYPPNYQPSSPQTSWPLGVATTTTPGTTTSVPSVTPTAPAPPAPTLVGPAVNGSSLATYNESLQLSYEILNTQLLLGGAISDRLQTNGKPKTTVTLGFPITITPPSRETDSDLAYAVAEVEISVCPDSTSDAPSIVTLLPQERTYNVASLVDKSFLGSTSAVLGGLVNVGGSFLWGHKTYYLVQQQETVAMTRTPASCGSNANAVSFAWQIRPVLGSSFLRPGQSINFVQVSLPGVIEDGSATQKVATACVSVHWRQGDKKGNYLGETIAPEGPTCYPVSYYSGPRPTGSVSVNDIGQGNVHVTLTGTFLPGSTIRIGSQYLNPAIMPTTHDKLSFDVSAKALAAVDRIYLVGRDNRELEITQPWTDRTQRLKIGVPEITPYSDSVSKVVVTGDFSGPKLPSPWVMVIGGNVFGLSDAPFFATDDKSITALVPTDLIRTSPSVEIRRLLWPDNFRDAQAIPTNIFAKTGPVISKTSIVSTANGLTLALTGSGLDNLRLQYPSCKGCCVKSMGETFATVYLPKQTGQPAKAAAAVKKGRKKTRNRPTVAKTDPPSDPTAGLKEIVVCRGPQKMASGKAEAVCNPDFPVVVLDIPKVEGQAPKPSLDAHDPIPLNSREVTVSGTLLDQVVMIEDEKQTVPFQISSDKVPTLTLDLPGSVAAIPGGHTLLVTFADKTTAPYTVTIGPPQK